MRSFPSRWKSQAGGDFALGSLGFHVPSTSRRFSGSGGEGSRLCAHRPTSGCCPWNGIVPPHAPFSSPRWREQNLHPWKSSCCCLWAEKVRLRDGEQIARRHAANWYHRRRREVSSSYATPPLSRHRMPWKILPFGDGISIQMSEEEWFQSMSPAMTTAHRQL